MSATVQLVRGIVGGVSDRDGWSGPLALLSVPVVPAAALGEAAGVVGRSVALAGHWCRRKVASWLRRAAQALDPVPTAEVASYPVAYQRVPLPVVAAPVEAEAPAVLPMPSAAQVTEAPASDGKSATVDYAAYLTLYGSQRAAAAALGIAVSTFRGRLKRQAKG